MKECPVCSHCFPDDVNHCTGDGEPLRQTIAGDLAVDGRYQLERRIGQGGMGVVYKARHVFLKTEHAVKIILPDLVGNDPSLATRFRQEAMAAAAIRHPNTVSVTDFGILGGTTPFLVMEFVEGRSLHEVLQQEGRLEPARALEIMLEVCEGVCAAHKRGIVHRDLKPLNVLLRDDAEPGERVKVLDFGLAKIKSGELLGSFVAAQTQGLMGSPFYMAPEQWSDEDLDARADIYSLGVILYQMLAGDVPFKGRSIPSIMQKHLGEPPPPLAQHGTFAPPEVEAVVRHALEKEPGKRPQSIEEFEDELRAALKSCRVAAPLTPDVMGAQTIRLTPEVSSGFDPRALMTNEPLVTKPDAETPDEAGSDSSTPSTSTRLIETSATPTQETPEEREARLQRILVAAKARNSARVRQTAEDVERQRREADERRELEARQLREVEEAREREAQEERARQDRLERERLERERRASEESAADYQEERQPSAEGEDFEAEELTVLAPSAPRATQPQHTDVSRGQHASYAPPVAVPASQSVPAAAGATRGSRAPFYVLAAVAVIALLIGAGALAFYLTRQRGGENLRSDVGGGPANVAKVEEQRTDERPAEEAAPTNFKPEMVSLPGGPFRLGLEEVPPRTSGLPASRLLWLYSQWPAREVSVNPFTIDRYEVTSAEYAQFVSETGHAPPPEVWDGDQPRTGEELWPVRNVSFEDAEKFAAWRSRRDGVKYRLPTEEEWEYAARGAGASSLYPWGDEFDPSRTNFDGDAPKPVGSFPSGSTPQGVADLIGNVWEWTSSSAAMYPGNDRTALRPEDRGKLVVRGGSYKSTAAGDEPVTATARRWAERSLRDPVLGFRLVREGR